MDRLIDRGTLPDWLLRRGIRKQLKQRLRDEDQGSTEANQARLMDYIDGLRRSPIAERTDAANEQHYEVPAAFYERVLGKHLKYSSGYWPEGVTQLDEAEAAMLELSASRAGIEDGMRVLDVGCGWGSMSLWIAEHFPGCRITSLSNSATQRAFIEAQCRARGLENLQVVTADINDFDTDARFDRIVSIEMFEHAKNYEALLQKVSSWLQPDGRLFVHIFVHKDFAYPFVAEGDEGSWMGRHFFTGGQMPSDNLLLYFQTHVELVDHWRVNGTHYAKTARAWLENLDQRRAAVRDALEAEGFNGTSEPTINRWRVFFMACEELWGYDRGEEWFVSHYLFRPRGE
ncbi:MAG: cyclopropane-fatty-acyl-phospholipid synthase family protein [Planctomycetota bacterium]|nr:cyclopropane-fatty-acyl-phospholipid synthase family protein [Planctomycetota bacterium]